MIEQIQGYFTFKTGMEIEIVQSDEPISDDEISKNKNYSLVVEEDKNNWDRNEEIFKQRIVKYRDDDEPLIKLSNYNVDLEKGTVEISKNTLETFINDFFIKGGVNENRLRRNPRRFY